MRKEDRKIDSILPEFLDSMSVCEISNRESLISNRVQLEEEIEGAVEQRAEADGPVLSRKPRSRLPCQSRPAA
jgi:hypothetical protein